MLTFCRGSQKSLFRQAAFLEMSECSKAQFRSALEAPNIVSGWNRSCVRHRCLEYYQIDHIYSS